MATNKPQAAKMAHTPGPIITEMSGCMECKRWPDQHHAPECVRGQRDELLALIRVAEDTMRRTAMWLSEYHSEDKYARCFVVSLDLRAKEARAILRATEGK